MMHDIYDLQCLNAGVTPGCYRDHWSFRIKQCGGFSGIFSRILELLNNVVRDLKVEEMGAFVAADVRLVAIVA